MTNLRREAEELESLLPHLMRTLFQPEVDRPAYELPLAQLRLARAVGAGARSLSELAEDFQMSPSAMSQLAHRLVESGYAEIDIDPNDRRVRRLRLTDEGKQRMERRRLARVARAIQALSELSVEERLDLLRSLRRLLEVCQPFTPAVAESLELVGDLETTLPRP